MVSFKAVRFLSLTSLLSVSAAALTLLSPELVRAQSITLPADDPLQQTTESTDPAAIDDLRPLAQDGSLLSIRAGQQLMTEAGESVNRQDYESATTKLQQARQLFNQLSNFYQELYSSFSAIDNRIADALRQNAYESAQMRDEATYQLALVHRARNQPDLAVPLLIQIVRSQNPTRDLGQRAYRQLFELGFVDSPYPRQESQPTSTAPANP